MGTGARILVADDNEEISSFLADYLAMMGHAVTVVDDGVKLLHRAIELRPHLIITDIQMPGGLGSAASASLRQREETKGIPVIFVSGSPAESFPPDTPSIRYIQKPLDHKNLAECIAELLPLGGYRP